MNAMRGQLLTLAAIRLFIEAGNATLTIQAKATQARFTFRFKRPENSKGKPVWVSVLNGSDNNSNYAFIGTLWLDRTSTGEIKASPRSKVGLDAPSAQAVQWLLRRVYQNQADALFSKAELWHEGTCGRCARKLTVPTSIASGFGPECITLVVPRRHAAEDDGNFEIHPDQGGPQ